METLGGKPVLELMGHIGGWPAITNRKEDEE
jgi:hypothetical protein